MDKIIYQGRIDTYLLLLKNLNIKASLTAIAWRGKVESNLLQDILPQLSNFKFNNDDQWLETVQEVGRPEEKLPEQGKLSKSILTPHNPAPKRKPDVSEKGINRKFENKNGNKQGKENTARWKSTPRTTAKWDGNNSKDKYTD